MQVAAWLSHIKTENIAYPACTLQYNGKQCSKKVQDSGGGQGDMQVGLLLPIAGTLVYYCSGLTQSCVLAVSFLSSLDVPADFLLVLSCSARLTMSALFDCQVS